MNGEIPVCKRCCICLPLRYGLIVWGYLKLIFLSLYITMCCYSIDYTVSWYKTYGNEENRADYEFNLGITITILIVMIVDFIMTVVFIIGGHKKNVKLLRVFYFYCLGVWVLTILLSAVVVGLSMESWLARHMSFRSWLFNFMDFSVFFVNIAIQTYFLLLLRSEIVKLKSNCEFRFVNNASEAECKMKHGEELPKVTNVV